MTKRMKDTSLDAWDKILNDGTLGIMTMKAFNLVENYDERTAKELLKIGVDDEIYPYMDRNMIAPRLTDLCNEGLIYRPYRRKCLITGKTVLVHKMAPVHWEEHRKKLWRTSNRKVVLHKLEIQSKTDDDTYHTAIWWHDGRFSCSCNKTYHRPSDIACHHIKGLYRSQTGRTWEEDHP